MIQTSCVPHSATGCHGNIHTVYFELKHCLMLQIMKWNMDSSLSMQSFIQLSLTSLEKLRKSTYLMEILRILHFNFIPCR